MVVTPHKSHKYLKVKLKDSIVYRCMIPGCPHYTRAAFLVNRIAVCWYCDKEFVINREMAKRTRIHCPDCTQTKSTKKIPLANVTGFLGEIIDG